MLRRAWEAGVGAVLAIGVGEDASGMRGALDHCRPPHLWCSSIARG
jgi:hypothetical protein